MRVSGSSCSMAVNSFWMMAMSLVTVSGSFCPFQYGLDQCLMKNL